MQDQKLSLRQKAHYESIHDVYEAHYYDATSMAYREEFIYDPMLRGLDLNDKTVADLACGSGHTSLSLRRRFPHVSLTGFDISPSACAAYERRVGAPSRVTDLTKYEDRGAFDIAIIIAGLHHCVSDLQQTLSNIAAMLRPGGLFIMLEPSSLHFLERVRQFWYRMDPSFDDQTEHALDHSELLSLAHENFRVEMLKYFGGPGCFLILQSMILRVPLWAKPALAPPAMVAERVWNQLPGPRWHNYFLARWERIPF